MTSSRVPYQGGAIDLGQLKRQAEAKQQPQNQQPTESGPTPFFTVTQENFESELVRRSGEVPVVAMVGSARSQASEQLKADLADLAEAGNFSFVVGYVDADATPQIAQVFGVQSLPTTIALGAGQPLTSFEGGQPRAELEKWLDALVQQVGPQLQGPGPELTAAMAAASDKPEQPAEDPRLRDAEDHLNAGDFDQAIAVYDAILAEEPGNVEITQARQTTVLLRRLGGMESDGDPVAAADAAPGDLNAQLRAADALVVAGNPEAAFARLINAIKASAGADKDTLKARLLELFALFDAADPRVLAARTNLASALY